MKKIKFIHCSACNMDVEPFVFSLWPGASVNVCPTCRIGIGNIGDGMKVTAMDAPPRDKMVRRAKVNKGANS